MYWTVRTGQCAPLTYTHTVIHTPALKVAVRALRARGDVSIQCPLSLFEVWVGAGAAAFQHNARTHCGPPSTGATITMDGGVADTARANTIGPLLAAASDAAARMRERRSGVTPASRMRTCLSYPARG